MDDQYQTPSNWVRCFRQLPILLEVMHWQLLRKWSLSEVWRITARSGKTWIAKWSGGSQSAELDIYLNMLTPLQIKKPSLHSFVETEHGNFFILEDLGTDTIEQQPQAALFLEAAKTLAHIRRTATRNLHSHPQTISQKYVISPQNYLDNLAFLLNNHLLTEIDKNVLVRLLPWFSAELTALYAHLPLTLNHNDYHAKNLVICDDTIVAIDWSNASINPHLGDLYCLIGEAKNVHIPASSLIEAFQAETQFHHEKSSALLQWDAALEWQIALGGICWLLTSLCWLLNEGIHVIPDSNEWIPGMLQEIEQCIALREKYC